MLIPSLIEEFIPMKKKSTILSKIIVVILIIIGAILLVNELLPYF